MDEKAWKEFEEQQKALEKKYKGFRRRCWLVALIYAVVVDVAIFLICKFANFTTFMPIIIIVNTGIALGVALFRAVYWKKQEELQRLSLNEKAPMGGFQVR